MISKGSVLFCFARFNRTSFANDVIEHCVKKDERFQANMSNDFSYLQFFLQFFIQRD